MGQALFARWEENPPGKFFRREQRDAKTVPTKNFPEMAAAISLRLPSAAPKKSLSLMGQALFARWEESPPGKFFRREQRDAKAVLPTGLPSHERRPHRGLLPHLRFCAPHVWSSFQVLSLGRTNKRGQPQAVLFCWCSRQDLNLHACAMDPKSIVSANSTTGAYYVAILSQIGQFGKRRSLFFGIFCKPYYCGSEQDMLY